MPRFHSRAPRVAERHVARLAEVRAEKNRVLVDPRAAGLAWIVEAEAVSA